MDLPETAQAQIASLSKTNWDVIVVGAGPAGGAAASLLAKNGASVLLVDRATFPREKVCGDALVPEAMAALRRIGISECIAKHSFTLPGYRLVSPSGATVDLNAPVHLLQRRTLDAHIAHGAVCSGAVFAQGQFQGASSDTDGVACTLSDRPFTCRILVAAAGADLSSLRSIGLRLPLNKPDGVAIRRYCRSSAGPDRPVFFLKEAFLPGYAWIFPLGDHYYNVGCGTFLTQSIKMNDSLLTAFETFLREDPIAKSLLAATSEMTPIRGASLRCGMPTVEHALQGHVLLAGEAIGTTIPGWGEGVSKALETGLLAGDVAWTALKAGDLGLLQNYPRRLLAEIKPDLDRHARVTRFFNRAWTANLLVNTLRLMPSQWR